MFAVLLKWHSLDVHASDPETTRFSAVSCVGPTTVRDDEIVQVSAVYESQGNWPQDNVEHVHAAEPTALSVPLGHGRQPATEDARAGREYVFAGHGVAVSPAQ